MLFSICKLVLLTIAIIAVNCSRDVTVVQGRPSMLEVVMSQFVTRASLCSVLPW